MVTAKEVINLQSKAEGAIKKIKELNKHLWEQKTLIRQTVDEHKKKRVELFLAELHARGLDWCTHCLKAFPQSEMELILLEGKKEYSSGGEYYYSHGFKDFSDLHCACILCREHVHARHGTYGAYNESLKGQSSFFAYQVRIVNGRYFVRRIGDNWEMLLAESWQKPYDIPEPTSQIIERLAAELNINLPPIIKLGYELGDIEKIIILE
jgi:hypothetical protein